MRTSVLADTGAILALLDHDDRWHKACSDAFAYLPLPLVTCDAVLTELFYLAKNRLRELESAWNFVTSGVLTIAAITDADLLAISTLMRRYRDRPMDFADATLVHLAERDSLNTVFTVDVADFQTYRLSRNKRFRILPGPLPQRY
jgi:uncharacterized protein